MAPRPGLRRSQKSAGHFSKARLAPRWRRSGGNFLWLQHVKKILWLSGYNSHVLCWLVYKPYVLSYCDLICLCYMILARKFSAMAALFSQQKYSQIFCTSFSTPVGREIEISMAKGAFSYLQRWMIIPPRFVVYMHTFGKADWMDDDFHVLPQMGHVLTSPPKK